MAARDREYNGGSRKFCREREAAVNERRQVLNTYWNGARASIGSEVMVPEEDYDARRRNGSTLESLDSFQFVVTSLSCYSK